MPSTGTRTGAWRRKIAATVCSATVLLPAFDAWANGAPAQPGSPNAPTAAVDRWSGLLDEAALRTGLPATRLQDLMRVESGGNERAMSSKGALGLMQVMPTTYSMLRAMLGLGANPLTPHDNILAGATYLKMLVGRYGWPGALAAYNAGPARLDAFLTDRRPLPSETIAYLWRLDRSAASERLIGELNGGRPSPESTMPLLTTQTPSPSRSSLFVSISDPQKALSADASDDAPELRRPSATMNSWRTGGLFASTPADPTDR